MFRVTDNSGFQIRFSNGWTASVQWGPGNYGDNRHKPHSARPLVAGAESRTAEVAAWDANDNWYDFGADKVRGWQTPEEVVAFLAKVAALPA